MCFGNGRYSLERLQAHLGQSFSHAAAVGPYCVVKTPIKFPFREGRRQSERFRCEMCSNLGPEVPSSEGLPTDLAPITFVCLCRAKKHKDESVYPPPISDVPPAKPLTQ